MAGISLNVLKWQTRNDHPLTPMKLSSMRDFADADKYHGATWETVHTLCDEVEFLQKENSELKQKLASYQKMSTEFKDLVKAVAAHGGIPGYTVPKCL